MGDEFNKCIEGLVWNIGRNKSEGLDLYEMKTQAATHRIKMGIRVATKYEPDNDGELKSEAY